MVCEGSVPVECLDIVADTTDCPGPIGGCAWNACHYDRNAWASIDRAACLERECGVEPLHDLECLESWADLVADCYANHCQPNAPSACGLIGSGAYSECHR